MRFRWLFGNFAEPQYRLPRRKQSELSAHAHKKYMPTSRLVAWTFLGILLPLGLLWKFAVPFLVMQLGFLGVARSTAWSIGVITVVALTWPLSAFVYGHLYTKAVRRSMRDHGFDVCVGCGYVLVNRPDDVTRCPECGRDNDPLAQGEASATEEIA